MIHVCPNSSSQQSRKEWSFYDVLEQELSAIPSDEMYVLLRDFNTPLSREALAKNDWFQAKAEEEEKTRFGGKDVGGVSGTYSHVGVGLDHLDLLLSVMKIVVHALPALHNNSVGLHCKSFGVLDTPNLCKPVVCQLRGASCAMDALWVVWLHTPSTKCTKHL